MSERRYFTALAVFVAAMAAGTALDVHPDRPATFRAGLRVLESDFHAHTRFSDGFLSPFDLVVQADRRGLDVLGITEHQLAFPGKLGRWFSHAIGGPTIVVGEEITTNRYHLIALGLDHTVHAGDPLRTTIDAVHAQGGVAIAAHPVEAFHERFETALDLLDGAEVMHPLVYGTGRRQAFGGAQRAGWSWDSMRDFYVHAKEKGYNLTAIGSSDYHFFSPLGVTRTLVFAERDDEASVLEALRRKKTVVYDLKGQAYGDPELVAALEAEPYVPREVDYNYRGSGTLDRIARLVGWFALLALVLLPRPRARTDEDAG
jgi:hypothetical protein